MQRMPIKNTAVRILYMHRAGPTGCTAAVAGTAGQPTFAAPTATGTPRAIGASTWAFVCSGQISFWFFYLFTFCKACWKSQDLQFDKKSGPKFQRGEWRKSFHHFQGDESFFQNVMTQVELARAVAVAGFWIAA